MWVYFRIDLANLPNAVIIGEPMDDKFAVDFDNLTQKLLPKRAYRLSDVADRVEKVGFDLVRFRDNEDTEQLWQVQKNPDGDEVIVALYNDNGEEIKAESSIKKNWEAIPDKKAVHVFYKGEALLSLSSQDLGVPADEFNIVRRWLPRKLETDQNFQRILLSKVANDGRKLIAQRFPELTKVANISTETV